MSSRLAGKVAVVTGGGAGLGRAVAERYAREGAFVFIAELSEKRGRDTLQAIEAAGGNARFVKTNIAEEEEVLALAQTVRETCSRLDILYNNAGILFHGKDTIAHELDAETFDSTLRLNLRGFWLSTKCLLPLMLERGGAVIHVGSPTALNGSGRGLTAYCVSKGGILGLTRVMAVDYADYKIRVNCIIPGTMDTPMNEGFLTDPANTQKLLARIPLGRFGTPEDVAGLAVFLASEDSNYCTGGIYMADGGLTAF